jgi:rhodanese-related sulfurtransferase
LGSNYTTFVLMKLMNYRLVRCFLPLLFVFKVGRAQEDVTKVLRTWNKETIPYVYVENIPNTDSIVYLDTREKEEYDVSHLKNAISVGYKKFDEKYVLDRIPDRSQPIIVYCSIGVRSENIGEKLKKLGYTKILNLHGGIFEWKNKGGQVFNDQEMLTDSVHAYSKHWGRFLHKGIKVY